MPIEAFWLALAAAFYPPAIVALIAVVRGPSARSRVFVYLAGAAAMTFGAGLAMLAVLRESGTTDLRNPSPSAAVEIALGVLCLALAAAVWRRAPSAVVAGPGPSRTERLTQRAGLVFVLGLLMYLPSPLYFGAVKVTVDADLSTAAEVAGVLVLAAIVLLMVEVPALLVLVAPERALGALETANAWLLRHAREIGAGLLAAGGAYLLARGLEHLLG